MRPPRSYDDWQYRKPCEDTVLRLSRHLCVSCPEYAGLECPSVAIGFRAEVECAGHRNCLMLGSKLASSEMAEYLNEKAQQHCPELKQIQKTLLAEVEVKKQESYQNMLKIMQKVCKEESTRSWDKAYGAPEVLSMVRSRRYERALKQRRFAKARAKALGSEKQPASTAPAEAEEAGEENKNKKKEVAKSPLKKTAGGRVGKARKTETAARKKSPQKRKKKAVCKDARTQTSPPLPPDEDAQMPPSPTPSLLTSPGSPPPPSQSMLNTEEARDFALPDLPLDCTNKN